MTIDAKHTAPETETSNDLPSDWFLEALVNLANAGAGLPVTLQVSGLLVSGTLASGADYFDSLSKEFGANTSLDPTTAESLKNYFKNFKELVEIKPVSEAESASVPESTPSHFIHLRGARFFNTTGNPIPANAAVWWRGRISEVSGFIIGTLSSGERR